MLVLQRTVVLVHGLVSVLVTPGELKLHTIWPRLLRPVLAVQCCLCHTNVVDWFLQHLRHCAEDSRMKADSVERRRIEREVIARVKFGLALEYRPFVRRVVGEDA
jgi:hypothetical protein